MIGHDKEPRYYFVALNLFITKAVIQNQLLAYLTKTIFQEIVNIAKRMLILSL